LRKLKRHHPRKVPQFESPGIRFLNFKVLKIEEIHAIWCLAMPEMNHSSLEILPDLYAAG
jgi:hypothetical protein